MNTPTDNLNTVELSDKSADILLSNVRLVLDEAFARVKVLVAEYKPAGLDEEQLDAIRACVNSASDATDNAEQYWRDAVDASEEAQRKAEEAEDEKNSADTAFQNALNIARNAGVDVSDFE